MSGIPPTVLDVPAGTLVAPTGLTGGAGAVTRVYAGTGLVGGGTGVIALSLQTPVAISHGGTGAINAAQARINLGITAGGLGIVSFPEAPPTGQAFLRRGSDASWIAGLPLSGGTITGDLVVTGTINGLNLASALPEAPGGGLSFLRRGSDASWQPGLPLIGGQLLGALILAGPPTAASPPNQAATKGYIDEQVTGAQQFIGMIDGQTGVVTYTASSGITGSALIPPSQAYDSYVVVSVTGTPPAGPLAGQALRAGDWVISDGTQWSALNVQGAGTITGITAGTGLTGGGTSGTITLSLTTPVSITNGGTGATSAAQALNNLGGASTSALAGYLSLSGGTMTGPLLLPSTAPTQNDQAVSKSYVDSQFAGAGTGSVTSVVAGHGLTGGTITTSGTIALSVPVAIADGGTGATTAGQALTNLGGVTQAYVDTQIAASGTVRSVAAGHGLTGGTITTTGTIALTVPVAITDGGTGATNAATALSNLGGTTQAYVDGAIDALRGEISGVYVGPTAPSPAGEGDLWFDPGSNTLYMYHTGTWLIVTKPNPPGASEVYIIISETKPTNPITGMLWLRPSNEQLGIWTGTEFRVFNQGGPMN